MQKELNELGLEVLILDKTDSPINTISKYPVTTFLCRLVLNSSISVGSVMKARDVTDRASRDLIIDAAKYYDLHPADMPASPLYLTRAVVAVTEMFNQPNLVFNSYKKKENAHSFSVKCYREGGDISLFGAPTYLASTPHFADLSDFSAFRLDVSLNIAERVIDVTADNGKAFQISEETFEAVLFPLYIERLDPGWPDRTKVITNHIRTSSPGNHSLGM